MKQLAKSVLMLGALAASGLANADFYMGCPCPYVGIDFKERWMDGKNGWDPLFVDSYPGGSLYLGLQITDYFSTEFGYESTTKRTKDASLASGTQFFGQNVTANTTTSISTRIHGPFIDFNGYIPFNNFDLIGTIGLAYFRPDINGSTNQAGTINNQISSLTGQNRVIWRAGVGAQYLFCDWGIRGIVRWEGTNSLRVSGGSTPLVNDMNKAFKASVTLSLGVFLRL